MATVEPGMVIHDRYQLQRPIGAGGMARVWLAHDRLLDREVAVKILSERYAADPDFVERFRREASAAAGLSHPNIVAVYDRGEYDGSYYIVMEHLPGPDLKAIIRQRGRLEPRQAVDAALQMLAALSAAHRRDVIHRDIKPQNVLVAEDGRLKVTDFGIARAGDEAGNTQIGSVIGTAQYLSPEQAKGAEVTPASDCYSVGIVLYEMLTGKVPFDGDKPVAIAMRQVNEPPVAPRLLVPQTPPQLNDIVMKALEKRPGNRYRTAEDFSQALLAIRPTLPDVTDGATQVLPAEPVQTTQVLPRAAVPVGNRTAATTRPPATPVPAARRRRRGLILGVVLALLVLGAGAAAVLLTDIGRAAKVAVPDVTEQNEEVARATLTGEGFTVKSRSENDVLASGLVIGTEPAAGTKLDKGAEVVMVVSLGPLPATVPAVVGQQLDDATARLREKNFEAKVVEEFSDKPKGQVLKQSPGPGQDASQGSAVTLTVSKGPEPVTVPSVLLLDEDEATRILEGLGLDVVVSDKETTKRDPGTVVGQDVAKGTQVEKGSTVTITVAREPAVQTIPMPDVTGNTAADATAKLQRQGFAAPTSETVNDPANPGTVVDQRPAAGTQVDPESTQVVIIVSDGPATATPPTSDTTATPPTP